LDVSQAVSLLAALGLGSLLTQYVSKGHERRSVRAEVLAALYAVELARRPGHGVFYDAVIEFQTRALIARVPRDTVRHYLAYAETAWMLAEEPDGVQAGRVLATTDVSEQGATLAAAIVAWIVWNPFLVPIDQGCQTARPPRRVDGPHVCQALGREKSQ
jgi:hypothetical protein